MKNTHIFKRSLRISIISVLLIGVAALVFIHYYNQEKVRQEFLAKGIYEIGGTFTWIMVDNSLSAYYMICQPPTDRDELIQLVLQYIQENNIVQELQKREPDHNVDETSLWFIEPSKTFPIGWDSKEPEGWASNGDSMNNHLLISVTIPRNAQSQSDYLIIVGNNDNMEIVKLP